MKRYIKLMMLMTLAIVSTYSSYAADGSGIITGVVTDENNQPLVGATIYEEGGDQRGAVTGYNGEYSIAVSDSAVLSFQYIGYTTHREGVHSKSTINVSLVPSTQSIDEVVVIGYGSTRRSDLTGSVASIKMTEIEDLPAVSVDQALQGRIAGADIMSTTGEPGATTSIRIRGTRSISASNEPLIVVDGVIDGVHDLNDINPSDIESISMLKDASSTAIYGARGSNGVIVVTTMQGQKSAGNRPSITFKTEYGVSQLPRKLDLMDADAFAQYRNDYALLSSADGNEDITITTPLSDYPYPNVGTYGEGTDWIDEITRTAAYQNSNISLSGANNGGNYFASFGYNSTEGIIDNSGMKRYTARFRGNKIFSDWAKAGVNLSYTYIDQDENMASIGGTTWWSSAIYLNPFLKKGSTINDLWYSGQKFNTPRVILDNCLDNARRTTMTNSAYVEIEPLKKLKFRSQFTYYAYQRHDMSYQPGDLPAKVANEGGQAQRKEFDDTSLLSENTINYELSSKSAHHFDALVGYTAQKKYSNNLSITGKGYTLDELLWNNMGAIPDKENISLSSNHTDYTKMSLLSRLNYNYDGRYYLTATARYDGASNFAANNKWGFFPSVALKWNLHKEKFMQDASFVDELALRVSAGRTGNDAISAYRSLAALGSTTTGYLFGESQPVAFYPSRLASPNLTWEKTDMYNLAADVSLFKGRLNLTAEGYISNTKDLLLTVQVATQTGYTSRFVNAGATSNKGFELAIESQNIVSRDFRWTTSFTISRNKQMVKSIDSDDYVPAYNSPSISGTSYMMYGYKEGYPLNALWGFSYAGVWHNEDEIERNKTTKGVASSSVGAYKLGMPKYNDINHDGVLNSDDLVYQGSADPEVYGGLQNTFTYKNLSLGVFFNYSIGGKIYNVSEMWMGNGSRYTNQYSYMADAWHPVRNPDSDLPYAGSGDGIPCDRFIHDASYLRLKGVSLNYTIDMKKATKGVLRDVKIGVSGENLYLWKRYNGFDPDVSSSSSNSALRRVDIGAYPKPRTVIFSLQIRY